MLKGWKSCLTGIPGRHIITGREQPLNLTRFAMEGHFHMPYSIADIARKAGVSTTTVSRVINHISKGVSSATRERVQAVIYEMNYRPNLQARGIAKSRSGIIGVIIPDVSNLFYPQILRGIDDYISERGYSMMLCNSDSDPEQEKKQLLSMVDNRVAGVILCSGVSNESFLKNYGAYEMPLVMIGRNFDSQYADGCIIGDNEGGMYRSTEYMIGHGHKDILYLDGPAQVAGPMYRLVGFRHAAMDYKVPVQDDLVCLGEFSIEYGFDTVQWMLDNGRHFTAVIAGSDLIAIGAVKALLKNGVQVPGDVEVMGFDNIDLSSIFEPSLSTISKPHYAMAQEAARMLLEVIGGKRPAIHRVQTASELILRDTTRSDSERRQVP